MNVPFGRAFVAALVALGVLFVCHWFDSTVLFDAQRRAGMTYDYGRVVDLTSIAHLLTAAGVVAIALAGWRSRSLLLGVGYALVGGYLVFLPALFWAYGIGWNGAPAAAPEPIASALNRWYTTLSMGVTGAVYTLGGAMLLTGLAVIWSVLRERRRGAETPAATAELPAEPEPPQP
jgi:cbb3-type cytochrome oxidase subunit 3